MTRIGKSQQFGTGDPSSQQTTQPAGSPSSLQLKQIVIGVLLSRKQAAELIGCSSATVRRLEKRGVLPSVRFNERLVRYRSADISALIASRISGGKEAL